MGILDFLKKIIKEILFSPDIVKLSEEITPEFLQKRRLSMRLEEYQKWLEKKITLMKIIKMERERKGLIWRKDWDEKINLIDEELKKIKVKK